MGEINLSRNEKAAIAEIDLNKLENAITKVIDDDQTIDLHSMRLSECGSYVSSSFDAFQVALMRHRKSKAAKKWAETHDYLRKSGRNLSFAVGQMKCRMEREQEDGKLFYVYDDIFYPSYFAASMSVTVRYKWRNNADEDWNYGSIKFEHVAEFRPDHSLPSPKRKPSAAKQKDQWEFLMRTCLCTVRDYFREGGDGTKIPEAYQVKSDGYYRTLNNYSAHFWGPEGNK